MNAWVLVLEWELLLEVTSGTYMDYTMWTCVQDCKGSFPCGGLTNPWDVTFTTQSMCCNQKMWWNKKDCNSVAPSNLGPNKSLIYLME